MLLSIIIFGGCFQNSKKEYIDDFYNFNYDYELKIYYYPDLENNRYAEYYLNGKLIRRTDSDGGCKVYKYYPNGKITETTWGRTCNFGNRTVYMYDSLNNHIGYYYCEYKDSVINLDTIKFDQIFFYDKKNRLIKERTDKRNDVHGNEFEIWKLYTYKDSLIKTEITLRNNDTTWIGKYFYNSKNQLIKIHREQNGVYETELFKYNGKGLLIEKEIISTENPVTSETSFSAGNNKRTYKYDSEGIIQEETVFNHKGEVQVKTIYKKFKKQSKIKNWNKFKYSISPKEKVVNGAEIR